MRFRDRAEERGGRFIRIYQHLLGLRFHALPFGLGYPPGQSSFINAVGKGIHILCWRRREGTTSPNSESGELLLRVHS